MDVLFDLRPHISRNYQKNKIEKILYYEYNAVNNTMGVMITNIVKFIIGINRNFRSDSPVPSKELRLGHPACDFKDV